MSYRVGLTGSIASGKSVVASRLRERGIPVIDLDKVGHEALRRGHEAFAPVVEAFGTGVLGDDGEIDRAKLASIVFSDAAARETLNAIVHPAIRGEEMKRVEALEKGGARAVVTEAALLIETRQNERFPFLVVVGCDPQKQLARLMSRDGMTVEEAKRRIGSQVSFDEKRKHADWVIDTSGSLDEVRAAADALAAEIERRAATGATNPA